MLQKETAAYQMTLFFVALAASGFLNCTLSLAASVAKVRNIRIGHHHTFTRLVFEVQGPHPSRIFRLPNHSLIIVYERLQTRVRPERVVRYLRHCVSKVALQKQRGSTSIIISLKSHTAVHYFFLRDAPSHPDHYRLVLDFRPQTAAQSKPASAATQQAALARRSTGNKVSDPTRPAPTAPPLPTPPPAAAAPRTSSKSASHLYQIANHTFLRYRNDLRQHALPVINAYQAALAKGPHAPEVPLALYRCALAHAALGDAARAETAWREVVDNYPQAPCVGLCWFHIGHTDRQRKAYLEAIEAFRSALTFHLDPATKLDLHYELGQCLAAVHHHREAIANYKECLAEDPQYYLQKPALLRSLGVSWFVLHQYAKSNDYLFRYLNLQNRAPDRDIVLARIADSLQHLGEHDLARKLYGYVEEHFPNSQGYIISELRQAESWDQQYGGVSQKAYAIYCKLAQLPLSAPLRKLVFFKLASWEYANKHYRKSLQLIHEVVAGRDDPISYQGFEALKQQVVMAWSKQALAHQNYMRVIQLYENNQAAFQAQDKTAMALSAAESYGKLQIYPRALAIYRDLLANQGSDNPDYLLKAAQYAFLMNDLPTAQQYVAQIPAKVLPIKRTLLLAQISSAQKNYQKTAQLFSQLLHLKGGSTALSATARLQYAESLMKLKKTQAALVCLQQASQQLGTHQVQQRAHLCLLQAKCYQALKQPGKAIGMLQQALSLSGSNDLKDQLNYRIATLYVATGNINQATAKLSALAQKGGPFWKTAAQQELGYLQLQNSSTP